ncbi:MAG: proton-conducting transporter membrane subunit, partial [Planctomycetota bacterium]
SEMRGLGRQMPITFGAFLLASVSIIGLPPGGGAWSKWFLAMGTVETHCLVLTAALMVSSLLNIAYLVPIPMRAFQKPEEKSDFGWREAPMLCVVPLVVTAVGSVALFFVAPWIYSILEPIAKPVSGAI